MRELVAFIVGAFIGGGVTAIYYRRVAAELGKLKQEVLSK
jgi:hypothetical protein